MNKISFGSFPKGHASHWVALSFAITLAGASPSFSKQADTGISSGSTKQGFPFLSGGVGINEREQMMRKARLYDLELSFADQSGQYLSDVRLEIANDKGQEIVNTTTNGPWYYIELPAGTYNLKATVDNQTRELDGLKISKDHAVVRLLHWNTTDKRMTRN